MMDNWSDNCWNELNWSVIVYNWIELMEVNGRYTDNLNFCWVGLFISFTVQD